MTIPIRKVWIDTTTREALHEFAWATRQHKAEVVRAIIEDIVANPHNVSALSEDDAPSEFQLTVKVPDELWEAGHAAAEEAGLSFFSMIRRRLIKLLRDADFRA